MEFDTKKLVSDYIRNATLDALHSGKKMKNTQEISEYFHISRSVASKYLNQLYEQDKLIKILSRPVYFFDREVLEKELSAKFDKDYLSLDAFLTDVTRLANEKTPFKRIVGAEGTLRGIIEQLKLAVREPTEEVSCFLLIGEQGTGKKYISKLFYQSLGEKAEDGLLLIDGRNFDTREFSSIKDHTMTLVLHVDYFSEEDRKTLLRSIDRTDNARRAKYVFVAGSTGEALEPKFMSAFDDILHFPPLKQRSVIEKSELIYMQLEKEQRLADKKLYISSFAFNNLSRYEYPDNIDGLKKAIRTAVANACRDKHSANSIQIQIHHLPQELYLRLDDACNITEDKRMQDLAMIRERLQHDETVKYCDEIYLNYLQLARRQIDEAKFYSLCVQAMNQYIDYLVFVKKINNDQISMIEKILDNIFDIIENKYQAAIGQHCAFLLARIIYKASYQDNHIWQWEASHEDFVKSFHAHFQKTYKTQYACADECAGMIKGLLDIDLEVIAYLFLILNFRFDEADKLQPGIRGLIIAHGHSTASSIADAANRLVGTNIFDAIDMPLDVQPVEIVQKAENYIQQRPWMRELILMVDMGSLEDIGPELSESLNIRIGVINNISTKAALDIGERIVQHHDMKEILETTCNAAVCTYKILERKHLEDAILFTSEAGQNATERVMKVFEDSVPADTNLHFLAYDYYALLHNGVHDPVFQNYNVLFITGTLSPKIEDVPFVALEDVIAFHDIKRINALMSKHLSQEEIKELNSNLLKNFSLENIMQSITILNPAPLMNAIEDALNKLQRAMHTQFMAKVMIGLYIHISSLVERLVTKSEITEYANLDRFKEEHSDFIKIFRESFREFSDHYKIEIPLNEISYLYEYIVTEFGKKPMQ